MSISSNLFAPRKRLELIQSEGTSQTSHPNGEVTPSNQESLFPSFAQNVFQNSVSSQDASQVTTYTTWDSATGIRGYVETLYNNILGRYATSEELAGGGAVENYT